MSQRAVIKRRTPEHTVIKGGEHLHRLISRLYLNRGITDISQVDYTLKHLSPPTGLYGIESGVALLMAAFKTKRHIVIVGDFDADGATATVLMIRALKQMGAEHVSYVVPNRFEYGYGLSEALVDDLERIKAELVITVDNGISSVAGVKAAKSKGMQVIVTDHHLPPKELPPADAIINPNCDGDQFPSKHLAGVGVAFYFISALRQQLLAAGWFEQPGINKPNLARFLDLVALGTVADLVRLDANNRVLVNNGLAYIRSGQTSEGMRALFQVTGCDLAQADVNTLGFYIAPRLNAAGRLEDMRIGIELLLTDDVDQARQLAARLHEINQQRKDIQADMQRFADSVIDELKGRSEWPAGVCLYHQNWHQGVVGLLASKVKELTNRPVVAFAKESSESDILKGSARSVTGVHIRDVLVEINRHHSGLINQFGGHAMAAGLSLQLNRLKEFQAVFKQTIADSVSPEVFEKVILTDGSVDPEDFSLSIAELIQQAGPWGQGFDAPVFDGWFVIKRKQLVGDNHTSLLLQIPDESRQIKAIAFGFHPNQFKAEGENTELCFQMLINDFRQRRQLQLKIEQIIH